MGGGGVGWINAGRRSKQPNLYEFNFDSSTSRRARTTSNRK
jgi:hypothetical protein